MKKTAIIALAAFSMFVFGCKHGPDENNNVVIAENGKTISNVSGVDLEINSGVTSLTIENSVLNKVTVNSDVVISFSNTTIEEMEVNSNVVIKESASGSGRSARAANTDKKAEKAKVVIDKLVMKGNVEAGVGLYKVIERAANASDKYFEFPEESTARVENYDDGVNTALALSPVYEGFDGVKIDVKNKPANIPGKSQMDVNLKKR